MTEPHPPKSRQQACLICGIPLSTSGSPAVWTLRQFRINSPVRSNVTLEAATLMRDIARDYGATFTAADLDLTRTSLAKSRARSFESLNAKLGMLANIGDYGLPADYVAKESAALDGLTLQQVQDLAKRFIRTDAMYIVVVGDAATQAKRLTALGYGAPVMVKLD